MDEKLYLSCLECGEVFECVPAGAAAARAHETEESECFGANNYEILTEDEVF